MLPSGEITVTLTSPCSRKWLWLVSAFCADSLRVFLCTSMSLYFTPKSTHTCCAVHCLLKICYGCFSGQKNRSLCFFSEFLILVLQILIFRLFSRYWAFKSHTVFKLRSSVCIHVSLPSLSLSSCSSEPMWIVRGSTQMPAVRIMWKNDQSEKKQTWKAL